MTPPDLLKRALEIAELAAPDACEQSKKIIAGQILKFAEMAYEMGKQAGKKEK